jgi:O-antigen/teichoic acid export membrane protein
VSATASVRRLARSGTLNLAGTLVGGIAGIALVIVVTNGAPADVAGTLFAATSFFLLTTAVATLGTDAGLAHTIQRQLAVGRPAGAVVATALRVVVGVSAALAGAVWVAAPHLTELVSHDTEPASPVATLRVLAVLLPVATAYEVLLATTLAHGTARPNVLVEKLGRLPAQTALVAVAVLLDAGPVGLTIAWGAPYAVGLVVVGSWCLRLLRGHGEAARLTQAERAEVIRAFWSFTAPRAAGRVCQVALQRADIVLVAALLGPAHAAVYTAATRFLVLGQLATQAVQQVLQPQLSGLFARGDLAEVRRLFVVATAWLMALAWPVYLVSAVAAPVLLQVFGDGYDQGHATVVILCLTMLGATACGSVDVVLLMAGRSRASLANNAAALVVDIVLLFLLVPSLGITGAALAWAAAIGVRNVLPVVQVRRAFGVSSLGAPVIWVAASAGLCFGVAPVLVTLVVPATPATMAVWLPAAGLAYVGLLWRGRRILELGAFRTALPVPRPHTLARRLSRLASVLVARLARVLRRLPIPHRVRVALSTVLLRRPGLAEVPLDRLLLGVQDGVSTSEYAERFDDLLWASTPIAHGPHAWLLRAAAERGSAGLTDEEILASPYGTHARRCLQLTGRYFSATDDAGIVAEARAFLARAGEHHAPVRVPAGVATTTMTDASQVQPPGGDVGGDVGGDAGGDVGRGAAGDAAGDAALGAAGGAGGFAPGASVRAGSQAHSGPRDPILVAPIRDSDCFQILDGHHRLATLAHRGARTAQVKVKRIPVTTPLQDLLSRMSWIGGKKELYQPIDAPELRQRWTVVRRCTDRLALMARFLAERDIEPPGRDYLDVASCYGWFVHQMGERGFTSYGVERDPLAPRLGAAVYGLDPSRIHVGDAVEFLREAEATGRRWDVVSCFSLLHHFVLGRGSTTAEELVRLLDRAAARVLFLDTGQEHEAWFAHSLKGWNAEHIAAFLREHTTFDEVVDLGPDHDAVGPYADNYGRHLFACVRG